GGGGAGAAPAGGGGAGGGAAGPTGLRAQGDEEVTYAGLRANPAQFFATPLAEAGSSVESDLTRRAGEVSSALEAGVIDTVNEAGVTGALRGMTAAKGQALDLEVYGRNRHGRTLSADLLDKMGSGADYNAAVAYLAGNNVLGARYELDASVHWYNDEESRIEATMRALSPEDLAALGQADPALLNRVEGVLDGTDQQVFQALRTGNYARADALRLRDRIDEARRDGNSDAVHTAIAESTAATSSGWGGRELTAEERRAAVVRELGAVVGDQAGTPTTAADGTPLTADQINTERAAAYVTRDIEVYDPNSEAMRTLSITGANRDLAVALLRHGEGSVEARAARLGVEMQRTGDPPSALNIDRAMFDERFAPDNPHATREEIEANERRRQAARAERAQALLLAAQSYGGVAAPGDGSAAATTAATATTNADGTPRNPLSDPGVTAARDALIAQMGARFGDDDLGRRLSAGLMTDERPSAQTASLAMQHAMYSHAGTNEELLWRFTERMTRDEVQAMRNQFRADTGRSLDAELGVYGQGGTFTELSGDDRLRMERALLGVARDDRERAEAAAFAIQQQRQETGSFGSWLASGSMAEEAMNATDARLRNMAGGSFDFSAEALMSGRPLLTGGNFDPTTGRYTGTGDRSTFLATTESAQQVAQNYASRIDAYANVATTGIAILGAIAAAVITVATGGAAGPLVAAAVIAGLASMGANYAIKGGRYGWEQAAVDLGMTAVQAVTAGVGAQLGAAAQVASKGAAAAAQASRTVVALSRIFGANPIVNQIMVGAITGAIGGLGNAALQEQTWEHGGAGAIGALFEGLARGMLSGAVTSAATQGLESLGGLGQRLQALSTEPGGLRAVMNMVTRGAGRAFISGTAGMAAKASEVGFDALAHPNRHVDAGDALMEIGQAGLHAALQALGEGAGEAVATGRRAPTVHAAGEAINAERARRGLPALDGPDLHAAAEDLLFLATHGRDRRDTAGHLDPIAGHGSLEAASKAMAGGPPAAPTRRPAHAEADEEGTAPRRSADEADPAARPARADERGATGPRPAAEGEAAHA
ncbi:MAG TPA: hypothetical protein VFL86_18655, partial [Burkholderiaceae bacterium]|nr:hypothetical protein [Burkholderiaceae bacterium]